MNEQSGQIHTDTYNNKEKCEERNECNITFIYF